MTSNNNINYRQSNVLQLLFFRYFPYWPLFIVLIIVLCGAGMTYMKIVNPVYEISSTVLIKDEKKGVDNPTMMESFNLYSAKKIVENEIEVIKSKTLMRETVEVLHLSSPVFMDGLLSTTSAYTTCPVSVEIKDIEQMTPVKRLDFSFDESSAKITLFNKSFRLNEWINTTHGTIRFVRNKNLKQKKEGPFYLSLFDPRDVTNGLLENFDVKPATKLSTVVNLSLKDEVPKRGENVLNMLMDSYNKAAVDQRNSLVANTLEFVENRIKTVEGDLDSVEHQIQQYKSTRGIVDLSEQGKLYLQNVGENDRKLSEINMQLAVLNKVEEYIVNKANSAGIVPSTLGINDNALSGMIEKLHDSEIQYERLRKTTAENNPILTSLKNQIENMRPGVLENIRNQRQSLVASRSNLSATNDKYASVLQRIPQKERELLEVNRQQSIKSNVYTYLLQKREETALSYASKVGDSRLVDKAEASTKPISPKKIIVFTAAFALAFFLGIAWVTIKEHFNNKILFRSEIESFTKIPIVAEISDTGLKEYIVIDNPKKPFLSEQFRDLRSGIGLLGKTVKKTVMVTSAISGEGKSFVSVNLAISLARSNKKVLLIDMDLHNPRISNFFNAAAKRGMAEYLQGKAVLEEIADQTVTPNLFLISAGDVETNPTETLLTGNLEDFFEEARNKFDYLIIDTPPVDPVKDAFVIAPFCDDTLFVMRHCTTPKSFVQLIDSNRKIQAFRNLSIVFNGVKSRGMLKNAFGYGYGYGNDVVYKNRQKAKEVKQIAM